MDVDHGAASTTEAVILARHRRDLSEAPSSVLQVVSMPLPALQPGEIRVRNSFQQIVAVNADLMGEDPGLPLPRFEVGEPIYGGAVGEVIAS